jgi:mono/diheme cytochrome c family protein
VIAATNVTGVVLLGLGALLVIVSVAALSLRTRTRGRGPEIPATMRPGPSDTALETPLLHKLQGWGVLLVAFFVVWFPITWLLEPSTNFNQEEDLHTLAVERGAEAVLPFTEENQLGVGCVRCHGPELRGGVIQSGATYATPPDLTNICAGVLGNPSHPNIATVDDIYQVIEQGRGVMPSWSIRFEGALTDQQINDIVNYLIEMSSQNVRFKDNICLNPNAADRATKLAIEQGAVLERP